VLYNLQEVLKATSILFCEGERDVETARAWNITATTSGAVGTWRPEFAEVFRGKRVAIIQDGDEPGRKHGQTVARSLVGVAEMVKLLEMPDSKDLSEWVERGGTKDKLLGMLRAAPELTAEGVAAWEYPGQSQSEQEPDETDTGEESVGSKRGPSQSEKLIALATTKDGGTGEHRE